MGYNLRMKKSLIETNPYLKDPAERMRLLTENAWESSVAEGARGLPRPEAQPLPLKRRPKASTKKPVNAS